MKVDEIRALNPAELSKQLGEAQQELFNLRLRQATKQLVNFREMVKVRKKIARMKTIMRERELGIR